MTGEEQQEKLLLFAENRRAAEKIAEQAKRIAELEAMVKDYEEALHGVAEAQRQRMELLESLLRELYSWVHNWSPDFVDDDEWVDSDIDVRIRKALEGK